MDFPAFAGRALTPPPHGFLRLVLRLPERELLEGLPLFSRNGLRGKRRRLVVQIALDEEVLADVLQAAGARGLAQGGFVRHRADDERGDVARISEADACLMGGVGALNELLCEGEIVADDDVDVLVVGALGFLCVSHVYKTTPYCHLCQEKMALPMGIEPTLSGL